MKIAALGDIHSNHFALEACLDYVEKNKIEYLFFLGDYVSDCPCPQSTLSLLRDAETKFKTVFIRGNREEYMLSRRDGKEQNWRYGSKYGSLFYTYENLTESDLHWFDSLPISRHIELDGALPFDICHGTMDTSRFLVLPNTKTADKVLEGLRSDLLLCAHSHEPFIYSKDGRTMVNGGSVGVSKTRAGHAEFSLLEYKSGVWEPQLVSIPYDLDSEIKEFYQSGFVEKARVWARCIMKTLTHADMYTLKCIAEVERLIKEKQFSDDLSEEPWELAAKNLGI